MNRSKRLSAFLSILIAVLFLLFLLFPLYWMLLTSFKDNSVLFKLPPEWWPSKPVLSHYDKLFSDGVFLGYYRNSLIVCFCTTAVTLLAAMFAGYGFSRFEFKFKSFALFSILSTQMLPVVSLLIALYTMYNNYHLLNTRAGLVIALTTSCLPFSIWMIKVFFDNIPVDLEESAKIDGATRFGILFRIVLPLTKPGLFSIGIYSFILSWDDFLYSITLINKDELRPLNAGIAIRYIGELSYDWSSIMTVCVTSIVPITLLFLFFQKYMVSGLTAGAVKG
ncbi:carbohydrate ABC transporter permease [Cohnella caldifontis]|uniref:carbohydrate ABC transporter permease n=1 Tax=Cohnella caldifontis TaxID=3027471 RepID=UPI0023EDF828|nr:carbohydrate ABC transporter permease [Cohnella sp. YIM B05605]